MKVLGYEVTRVTNMVIPPQEVKTKEFTYMQTPTEIVAADVSNYKDALIAAKGKYVQQRSTIYDIYQNALDFDIHLKGLIERRLLNTSGKVFEYVINDEPSEIADNVLNDPDFTKLINDLLMVNFWGMGLFEFDKDFNYTIIPIKHIDPFEKMVRKVQYSTSHGDVSYDGLKNVVFIGGGNDFGMLQQLALYAMYKRAALGDWAQYSQLAGTNFRVVKYRGDVPDPARRLAVRTIVNNAGQGTLDLPDGIDVETSNQTSSSQNQLFENYVQYLDDNMTKLVLGQTMTTEDGSSRSQAEVHERVQDTIFDSDGKFILTLLNYDLAHIMASYGVSGGRWKFVENSTTKQSDEIERDLKLKELGIVFTDAELRLKYDIGEVQQNEG